MSGTVFITGANVGVGLATTSHFLSKGWNIVATTRDGIPSAALRDLQSSNPSLLHIVKLDLMDPSTVESSVSAALALFSRIDVLVNNAGYGEYGPVELISIQKAHQLFEVNFYGPLRLIKAFLPHFHTAGPSGIRTPTIVNVSSGGAHFGFPLGALYHASKAALESLTECIAFELSALSIPVATKLVIPYGGISGTNFFHALVRMNKVFEDSSGGDSAQVQAIEDYKKFTQDMMAKFQAMAGASMSATQVAEVVFEAATDLDTRRLRYFTGAGAEPSAALKLRYLGSLGSQQLVTKKDFDEMDDKYVKQVRALFE
ncbi:hypothetical protein S40288_06705 [Stachybotrys chartarum IBT 40288]|nr:hypothetical protein S40288_06705 [Stachybotrys chartarum IBT 40288]